MFEMMMMDTGLGHVYVENLNVSDGQQLLFNLKQMKNVVIGSNRQKTNLMLCGAVPRLLQIMTTENTPPEILVECGVLLGSFAKGTEANKRELMEDGVLAIMMQGLAHNNLRFVESCLRFLRTMLTSPIAPTEILFQDSTVIPHMIQLLPRSPCTQSCVASILAHSCKTADHQEMMFQNGAIQALSPLLTTNVDKIRLPALQCFAAISYQNKPISLAIASAMYNGESIPQLFCKLMARDSSIIMQLTAAKCLAYLCRSRAIRPADPMIVIRAMPTLVRMCKKDRSVEERVDSAEVLAYLIEEDVSLQRTAAITDHLILTLGLFIKYTPDTSHKKEQSEHLINEMRQAAFKVYSSLGANEEDIRKREQSEHLINEMRQAAFKVYSSLGANEEDIRKRIIETDTLMDQIEKYLSSPTVKVQLASVRCLHSLSRSVQQLRTSFQDHAVWKPLMKLLQTDQPEELLTVASSTLCNLLLEFSPSKEPIVDAGAIELLCKLTSSPSSALRLNGIWGLMNMAFQAEQKIKSSILMTLGTDQLFRLLTDTNVDILMKTLGLLRNLLSTKPHIDSIMSSHSKQIMTAVIMILEDDHPPEVKEQTLCILANIADGNSAKDFIMSNEDILKKITYYMRHENVRLQIAAVYCINNLVWNEEEGSAERRAKLKEYGVQKHLQSLLSSSDTVLFDKVKTALQQFSS